MADIKVTSYQELHNTARQLNDSSQTYRDIYKSLLNLANEMGQAWEGADNKAYVERINGIANRLEDMSKKLEVASKTLDTQATNYETAQSQNAQQAGRLPS